MSTTTPPIGLNRFATHGHHRLSYEFVPAVPPSRHPAVPVVLLHALLVGRGEFAALRERFAGAFPLVLPDARGHGASAGLADQRYSVAEMAAELGAVLDEVGGESYHLVGHELGALAALVYAQANPDRLRSLTLIDAHLPSILDLEKIDPTMVAAIRDIHSSDEAAAETAYKGLGDRAVDQYLSPRWGSNWRDRIPKPRLATIRRNAGSLAGLLAALNSVAIDPDALARLHVPTLVLDGELARPTIRLTAERLSALIPAARLASLPSGVAGLDLFDPATSAALSDTLHPFLAAASPA